MDFIEWLDGVAQGIIDFIDNLIPAPPEQLGSACESVAEVGEYASLLSFAVPWGALTMAVGILVAAVAASIAIRIARIGVSVGTGGGGA